VAFRLDDDEMTGWPGLIQQPRRNRGTAQIASPMDEDGWNVSEFVHPLEDCLSAALKEPESGSATAISPSARITTKMMPPPMMYPNKTAGPASPMVFAEP